MCGVFTGWWSVAGAVVAGALEVFEVRRGAQPVGGAAVTVLFDGVAFEHRDHQIKSLHLRGVDFGGDGECLGRQLLVVEFPEFPPMIELYRTYDRETSYIRTNNRIMK
jgi:hypothetical protein